MSNQKFNIGDTVEIVDWGEGYSNYSKWVKEYAPEYTSMFKGNWPKDGWRGEVVKIASHESNDDILCLVEVKEAKNEVFLMAERGLKLITPVAKTYTYKQALKKAIDGYKMEAIESCITPNYLEFIDNKFKMRNIYFLWDVPKNVNTDLLFQVYLETPKFPIGQPVLSPSNDIGVIRKITHRKSDVIYWVQFNQNNDNLKQFKQAELKEV